MRQTILHLSILLGVSWLLFFFRLGAVPLTEPDEGRNAEVAREMIESSDWVTPHLNYERKLNKPILFFWASALSMKLGGVNESSARFPSAAAAAAGVIAVYFLGRRMTGTRAGLFSALILATCPAYMAFSRIVIFDMMLTLFITVSLLFFYFGFTERSAFRRRIYYLMMYGSMALAVLTKGPIGVLIPGGIIVFYLLATGNLRAISRMEPILGPLLFLIIAAPWYVAVSIKNPEFPRYFFITEHITRYTTDAFSRVKPWWYYLQIVIGGSLPWVVLLPGGIRGAWERIRKNGLSSPLLLPGLWALLVLVFFSFSRAKLAGYVLPLFPALALLCGSVLEARSRIQGWLLPVFLSASFVIFAAGLWAYTVYAPDRSSKALADAVKQNRQHGDLAVSYETFRSSLVFYIGGPVPIITDNQAIVSGNFPERDRKISGEPVASLINRSSFAQMLKDKPERVFIVGQPERADEIKANAGSANRPVRLLLQGKKADLWVSEAAGGRVQAQK